MLALFAHNAENGPIFCIASTVYSLGFMAFFTLGINHTTASLDTREKLAFAPAEAILALEQARMHDAINEVALLSTCNRTELYCDVHVEPLDVLRWLAQHKGVDLAELVAAHYCYEGREAARHMMCVASGLDSLVLGEPQILGQMKSAYAVAQETGTLGSVLHDVFQRVFSVAKKVRSETAIGQHPVSVAYAAVTLAQQIFSDLKDDTALLIGAGETIELVAKHLVDQGIKKLIVANRTLENAQVLAKQFDAEAILLVDIPQQLYRADIVISSTASQLPLLGKGAVEYALKARKHKPMFMVDIAVPRDIESQVGELDDVFLYTVDDLADVIDKNKRSREDAADIALQIVEAGAQHYEEQWRALSAVSVIRELRERTEQKAQLELQRALKALATDTDPRKVLAQFSRSLTNKFLHEPTAELKKAGAEGRNDIIKHFQTIYSVSIDHDTTQDDGAGCINSTVDKD